MEENKWKKTALLVIDMRSLSSLFLANDFILPGGSMHVGGGQSIVPAVEKAVAIARERGALIVWVVREHDPSGRDVEYFLRHLYGVGKERPVSKGTKGAELVEGINCYFILFLGVQTPNCIRQTVFEAVALDYRSVTVLADQQLLPLLKSNLFDIKNLGVIYISV
ncbi:hypothetical protein AMTRI_Chr07g24980 [Amborella trichopoda]